MTPSFCTTCGREISEGQGRYSTADGVYCLQCGLPFPMNSNVRVHIVILDPEHKLDQYAKYANKNRR